jgi:hypothetical protein
MLSSFLEQQTGGPLSDQQTAELALEAQRAARVRLGQRESFFDPRTCLDVRNP